MRGSGRRLLLLPHLPALLLLLVVAAAVIDAAASASSSTIAAAASSRSRRGSVSCSCCAFVPPAGGGQSSAWGVRRHRSGEPRAAGRYTAETFSSDDPLQQDSYWEELFMKGSAGPAPAPEPEPEPLGAVGVEVISFDLDDTLWCGKAVIANANKALQAFLEAEHPTLVGEGLPTVWSLMGALATQYPDDFLEDPEDSNSVVRFTDLRKLALSVLAHKGGYGPEEAQRVAEDGFQAWHDARHAVDDLFFPGVLDMLRRLKARGTRLVAVTNGNCDIGQIAAFDGMFDFCVNAEKVGARKRTGRPYTAAIKQAGLGADVGPRWVHVGDDFTEDIVAAKSDLKLRTVWYHTAERKAKADREAQARQADRKASLDAQRAAGPMAVAVEDVTNGNGPPSLSTLAAMTTEGQDRFFKDKAAVHVTSTEADDFLTFSIVKEFADAEVETIAEMAAVLEAWLDEGENGNGAGAAVPQAKQAQAPAAAPAVSAPAPAAPPASSGDGEDTKFCIACREVLPKRAKFCSACGEAQV